MSFLRMRSNGERRALMLCGVGACLLVGTGFTSATGFTPAQVATDFSDWQAAVGPTDATFSDVAMFGHERVYAGFIFDPILLQLTATLFTADTDPGPAALTSVDLGFTVDPSVAVSIARRAPFSYWVAVSQNDGVFASHGFTFHWSESGGSSPQQIFGPLPGLSDDVSPHEINREGTAVGLLDSTVGIVAPSASASWTIPSLASSNLFGIDSSGTWMAGNADFGGGVPVAAIFHGNGVASFADTVPGTVRAVQGSFAVGERNGIATYWRLSGSTWEAFPLLDAVNQPVPGELLALDSDGLGIGGGMLAGGGAIVALLNDGSWFELEDLLGMAPDTLWAVHGIDVGNHLPFSFGAGARTAFAVEAFDFSGWDVTATTLITPISVVPGPGPWLTVALVASVLAAALRRVTR